jgi:hypothetical protein
MSCRASIDHLLVKNRSEAVSAFADSFLNVATRKGFVKQMSTLSLSASRFLIRLLILGSLLTLAPVAVRAADAPKFVFVKASCLDKISSDVLSSLEEGIRNSQKYRWARNLGDGDQMGIVFTINVSCSERKNVVAVATVFGAAKCFSATNCHHAIDGSSIRSDLCDANAAEECGRTLFKAFDDYVSNPIKPQLKLGHN